MITLVIGGAACGKSEYAERIAISFDQPRCYIATMEPYDGECLKKIARHRKMRAEKGFVTIEQYRALENTKIPESGSALLECLGTLTSNELFCEGAGFDSALHSVKRGLDFLAQKCKNLVIVTNDVFSGGMKFKDGTSDYLRLLGSVNCYAAALSQNVVNVISGIPVCIKGEI